MTEARIPRLPVEEAKDVANAAGAVLAATDEVVRDGAVSAETWSACSRELGPDSEDGVSSWPPEGRPTSHTIR